MKTYDRCAIELLEGRCLLAANLSVSNPVNITRMTGNQNEGAVAVDPANPMRVVALSNEEDDGLMFASSVDGGATWNARIIATETDRVLPDACCDPTVAFDSFGNLFIGYVSTSTNQVVIATSADGGGSFKVVGKFNGDIDQPTVVTGPGKGGVGQALWVTFAMAENVYAAGARINGLGSVGAFGKLNKVPMSGDSNFGDIAVGPLGQVMVGFQMSTSDDAQTSVLFASLDPDGVGPLGFQTPVKISNVNVGPFETLKPQKKRAVDAEISLGFDRSDGPYRGRVYAAYTDRATTSGDDSNTVLRYSDTNGATWSAARRVNDDNGTNSQLLPKLAVDPVTGLVGIGWHDAREDLGVPGHGSTDAVIGNDVEYYATVVTPTPAGLVIAPNVKVSGGATNAADSDNEIDLGDYTGISFYNGVLRPVWADNSNSTGDNPDGAHSALDLYTAAVNVTAPPLTGAAGSGLANTFSAKLIAGRPVKSGKTFTFTVDYTNAAQFAAGAFGTAKPLVARSGKTLAVVTKSLRAASRTVVEAVYQVSAPGADFKTSDNGTYVVTLPPGMLLDLLGRANPQTIAGKITVAVPSTGKAKTKEFAHA